MEKKFDEKMFLSAIKELNGIVPYLSSNPVARRFLELARLHCGFREEEMYVYLGGLIQSHMPELKNQGFNVKTWKKIFTACASNVGEEPANLLRGMVNVLDKVETFEAYFDLICETFSISKEVYTGACLANKAGWIHLVDTLVKVSEEYEVSKSDDTVQLAEREEECIYFKSVDSSVAEMEENSGTHISKSESSKSRRKKSIPAKSLAMTKKVKKSKNSSKKGKRGYSIPVYQYRKVDVYNDVESAARASGIEPSSIMECLDSIPDKFRERVWKYADSKRSKIVLYSFLHSYKNQSDIDRSSESICGRKIHHNNIIPQLKQWKQVYNGEYVWVRYDSSTYAPGEYEMAS